MSRVMQCFKMLEELEKHKILNQKQLAELLDTNPRNIREYRRELANAGIPIEEKRGRNGGYFLSEQTSFFNHPQPKKMRDEIKFEQRLEGVIEAHRKIRLTYQSLSHKKPVTLRVDPLGLIHFNNGTYLVGYCHNKGNYDIYSLNRDEFLNYEVLEEKYRQSKTFNMEEFLGNVPLFHGKVKKYRLRLNPIEEKRFLHENWGDFLEEEGRDETGAIYSFYSDQEDKMIERILMEQFELLSPDEAREQIRQKVKNLEAIYA